MVGPVYVEGRRVQFWYVDHDRATDTARLGYELVAMCARGSRNFGGVNLLSSIARVARPGGAGG
jgi:hypothetical protein